MSELTINPIGCKNVRHQADKLLDSLSLINDSDRIKFKIKGGESESLEFKRSLSLNIKMFNEGKIQQSKSDWEKQETAVFKTLVAFMNTHGGTLLIGVTNIGDISGVDTEMSNIHKENEDTFLKFFKDKFSHRIGPDFLNYIFVKFIRPCPKICVIAYH